MKFLPIILVVILISLAIILFGKNLFSTKTNVSPTVTQAPIATQSPTLTIQPTIKKEVEILVTKPQPNEIIKSPLEISGKAPGNWFFEAQAPIMLVDGDGKTIATGQIRAQSDWQTTNLIPFIGELSFDKPKTATGILILQNDNPSGLPENSKLMEISIRFQ